MGKEKVFDSTVKFSGENNFAELKSSDPEIIRHKEHIRLLVAQAPTIIAASKIEYSRAKGEQAKDAVLQHAQSTLTLFQKMIDACNKYISFRNERNILFDLLHTSIQTLNHSSLEIDALMAAHEDFIEHIDWQDRLNANKRIDISEIQSDIVACHRDIEKIEEMLKDLNHINRKIKSSDIDFVDEKEMSNDEKSQQPLLTSKECRYERLLDITESKAEKRAFFASMEELAALNGGSMFQAVDYNLRENFAELAEDNALDLCREYLRKRLSNMDNNNDNLSPDQQQEQQQMLLYIKKIDFYDAVVDQGLGNEYFQELRHINFWLSSDVSITEGSFLYHKVLLREHEFLQCFDQQPKKIKDTFIAVLLELIDNGFDLVALRALLRRFTETLSPSFGNTPLAKVSYFALAYDAVGNTELQASIDDFLIDAFKVELQPAANTPLQRRQALLDSAHHRFDDGSSAIVKALNTFIKVIKDLFSALILRRNQVGSIFTSWKPDVQAKAEAVVNDINFSGDRALGF